VTFLAKGKSLSNTPRPIRNLIGDSATWRQDDWSTTVGKSLPRTPVNKPKLYPDLSAITETVEPSSDGVALLPAPGIPEKRKRANNVKHQLLVRKSERLKGRACQNTENGKEATKQENYLEIVNDSENEEDEGDDDFESKKSHLESDTEENDKVIEERVEAELKKKEVAAQPATGHQQNALPFSSTPLNKTQNLYTAFSPPPKVEPATLPDKPEKTQPLPSTSNPQTITSKQSIPPTYPPSKSSTVRPFDCSTVSNQSYYNSQKLLQNQQQQTIALLSQVPEFNGMGSTKFEDWIQHFERVVDTAEFEEGRKIKLLGSRFEALGFGVCRGLYYYIPTQSPKESKVIQQSKQNLHERFHGGDNRKMYFTEFKNCVRNSGEPSGLAGYKSSICLRIRQKRVSLLTQPSSN
jgi:hypothetical protein